MAGNNHEPRTSLTDPLFVNWIPLENGAELGITFCPGKHARSLFGAPWERDLKLDIGRIAADGTQMVITLVTQEELDRFKVSDLGSCVRNAEMEWIWMPIPDTKTPDGETVRDFKENVLPRVRDVLLPSRSAGDGASNPGKVVVHCRGGLGRAGTVACMLLVDLGFAEPEEVIDFVRKYRKGAVENYQQEEFVRNAEWRD